ncbi:Mn-containing catalase [Bradyrhizobium sp. CIR3A]|nr:Mn-containing catalase [Bradyrhizobium sp. CIR3A]MBB4392437.1 Mn-containing catalase [Bradyrhizobium sp. ERR14]NYG48223.1 Mn-containing catalase [Bradyrhizobium sp. IAR9]
MYCNVAAKSTGRTLVGRLYNSTSDTGMQDMLSYLIAHDTMHQQQ